MDLIFYGLGPVLMLFFVSKAQAHSPDAALVSVSATALLALLIAAGVVAKGAKKGSSIIKKLLMGLLMFIVAYFFCGIILIPILYRWLER